jgi:hypothetical protein
MAAKKKPSSDKKKPAAKAKATAADDMHLARVRMVAAKADNDKKIVAFANKHSIPVQVIRDDVKHCLYQNLRPDRICNKRKLRGSGRDTYHYHVGSICVINYRIVREGTCEIPTITDISTMEAAHKRYKRKK